MEKDPRIGRALLGRALEGQQLKLDPTADGFTISGTLRLPDVEFSLPLDGSVPARPVRRRRRGVAALTELNIESPPQRSSSGYRAEP
jgi:hypothetical protein